MRPTAPRTPSAILALALILAARVAPAQAVQDRDPRRPPHLEPTPECEVWVGTGTGNDPTKEIELRLCTQGERVTGASQFSSLVSGWSTREIEGAWVDAHRRMVLRETRMVDDRPLAGWMFCLVDRYELVPDAAGGLAGTYDSVRCDDHARIAFRAAHAVDAGADASVVPVHPTNPALVPPPTQPRVRTRHLCSAEPAGPSARRASLAGIGALACALAWRYRGRRR